MATDSPGDSGPETPDLGNDEFDPRRFSGVVRVFPLPAPSLYPRVVQPLHIFEDRYRDLMREALDSDGLIAMAMLKPGWEIDYASRPPLEEVACLGKIVAHHRLDDGRYNLLLAGVSRVRLLDEVEPPDSFRKANAELLSEQEPSETDAAAGESRRRLISVFKEALPPGGTPTALQDALDGETPLGLLADLAAYALPIKPRSKQVALAELNATLRSDLVASAIERQLLGRPGEDPDEDDSADEGSGGAKPGGPTPPMPPSRFPPPFSDN